MSKVLEMYIKCQDMASGVMAKVGASVDSLRIKTQALASQGLENLNTSSKKTADLMKTGLVVGATAGVAMLGLLGGTAIKNAADFEIYRATLTTMLGTQELANARLKEYADIGKSTPFELPQVVALGNQLQALGRYSRTNVVMLGDLAAAAGKPIDQVGAAFAKLASGQKGVAVDMFRDLLITTEDWSKATGKGVSKQGELMATTEEMLAVLPKIMADKKFNGMMANQAETFTGKMSNLLDTFNGKLREIGEKILPIIKPYIDKLIQIIDSINIDEIIQKVGAALQDFRSKAQPVVDYFTQHMDQLHGILLGVATAISVNLVGAIAVLIGQAAVFLAALWPFYLIAAVVALLYIAWQNQATIIAVVNQVLTQLQGVMMSVWQFIQTNFGPLLDSLAKTWETIRMVIQLLMPGLMAFGAFLFLLGATIVQMVIYAFQQLQPALQMLWGSMQQLGLALLDVWNAFLGLWNVLAPIIIPLFIVLAGVIATVLYPAFIFLLGVLVQLTKGFTAALAGVVEMFTGVIVFLTGVFTGDWSKAWEGVKMIFDGFIKGLAGALIMMTAPFVAGKDTIMNIMKSIDLYQMGVQAIQGFINGVGSMANSLADKVKGTINGAINGAKNLLGIKSPSRVFMQIGEHTAEGMAIGIDKGTPKVKKSTDEMVNPDNSKNTNNKPESSGGSGGASVTLNFYGLNNDEKSIREMIRTNKQAILRELGLA